MARRLLLLTLVLLLGFSAPAGAPYFSTVPHHTLYYERYKAGKEKVIQTTTLEIGTIEKVPGGRRVNYKMTLRKANGREIMGGTAEISVLVTDAGDVQMDIPGAVKAVVENMLPLARVTAEGNPAILPAVMSPGDTLPDSHSVISISGVELEVDITSRTVLRKETISTPAGTFECVVAREHRVENAPFHHLDTWSDTWYAPGYGFVQHDDYDRKMRLETREILISDTAEK